MNIQSLVKPASRLFGRGTLILKRYLPEILTTVGIGTSVASTVVACKATAKLAPVVEEHEGKVEEIRKIEDEKAMKKALTKEYVRWAKELTRLYGPAAALELVSIACSVGSNRALRHENKALAAAYMGLLEAQRRAAKKTKGDVVVDEEGNVENPDTHGENDERLTPYARMFGPSNKYWRPNHDSNMGFLIGVQNQANDMLRLRGHLFLNEVYDMLGIPRSEEGQIVGWVHGMGDSYVDLGLYKVENSDRKVPPIWLDFNVDGSIMYIFDKMWGGNGKDAAPMVCD